VVTLWIGGCGDFITGKTAGRESNSILDELAKIEPTPEANIPMPSIYTAPPIIREQIVGGVAEFKLFYFCRHHTSDILKAMVYEQYATKLFNKKAQSTTLRDYTVSSNPATNQLIVRCPTREDINAVLEFLQWVDVPPIQVKIDCLISEIYADKTLDWETTLEIENLIGENIWAGPAGRAFGDAIMELVEDPTIIPAFPGASLREVARARMGLKVGYLSKNHDFLSLVDLLESQGYLKILMNPTLEVVNGKTATISSSQRVPVDKAFLHSAQSEFFTTKTEWADVVDSLKITPHVFADGYIGLETDITLGSKLTPEGIKQVSIVTKKQINNKENRIRPGESLIIGGLRKSERRDVVRGIPFLKDIPLLGILFSGRDFEERAVETIFILTPTISTGGIPNKEMMEEVEKQQMRNGKSRKNKTDEAEQARVEAEAEKAVARTIIREAEDQANKAETEAQKVIEETEKATAAQQQAKSEVEKAKVEVKTTTEKANAAVKEAMAQITKLTAESDKLKAEAEKAKAEAQKAAAELELAKAAAQKATAEADKAKADAQKAVAEADKAKADTAKTTAEAEKAKADADKAKADAATAKAEAQRLTEETTTAKAEAQKAIAEADAKAKDAEKAKAEAEAEKAATQKIKSEAEKAKAEADAKAEKPKQKGKANKNSTKTEKPKRKGKANKNNAETEKPKAKSKKQKEKIAKKNRNKKNKANAERRQGKKKKQPKQNSKRNKKRRN
jgi:hypothetical protein